MPSQNAERRNQHPLRLRRCDGTSSPSLPHRPLAHGHLETNDVPGAGARRAVVSTQRVQRFGDLAARVDVPLRQRVSRLPRHPLRASVPYRDSARTVRQRGKRDYNRGSGASPEVLVMPKLFPPYRLPAVQRSGEYAVSGEPKRRCLPSLRSRATARSRQ